MSYAYLKTGSKIYMQLNVKFMIEDQSWNAVLTMPVNIELLWFLRFSTIIDTITPPSTWSRNEEDMREKSL